MSCSRQAMATSGSKTGVTTKAAPASFASITAPGSHTVPTPIGNRAPVVARSPRTMSKQDGTVVVISRDCTPPSSAARQAWKPASESVVRSTPHKRLGKAWSRDSTALRLAPPRFSKPAMVHTYDWVHRHGPDHDPAADHPGGGRLPPGERLLGHQRPG